MGTNTSVLKDWMQGNSSYIMDSDIDENNGLILNNVFFPEEMLIQILLFVDHDSLVYKGRRVCKVWRRLIESSVLKSKVDNGPYRSLATVDPVVRHALHLHWSVYYLICKKDPFEKNLLRNPSGTEALKYWELTQNGGDKWKVEPVPEGVEPLPETDKNSPCFVTSYHECEKQQLIRLVDHGFSSKIMDEIRPVISIRELYSARWDCGGIHMIRVTLLDKNKQPMFLLDEDKYSFTQFEKIHEDMERMEWHEVRHEFENYPPGVRFIKYCHGGRDSQFWAGHFGAKISGSSVKLIYPAPTEVVVADEDDVDVIAEDEMDVMTDDDVKAKAEDI